MENGSRVRHILDPLLGTGSVVKQIDGHPEFVVVEWVEEWPAQGNLPADRTVTTKTCHVDELRVVNDIDEVCP